VGLKLVASLLALVALGGAAPPSAVSYLEQQQTPDGGFAERGATPDAASTAWGALALVAGGGSTDARGRALTFLRAHEGEIRSDGDAALQLLARVALGDRPDALLARVGAYRPGSLVNATAWTVLALREAGKPLSPGLVSELRTRQQRSGGWSWTRGGAPDSNDTTAWVIQATIASGHKPAPAALRFLAGLRRPDGSYRYSRLYATTPVWVTSQVVPALARKPFPLPIT